MIGAIAGDIIGSSYEGPMLKSSVGFLGKFLDGKYQQVFNRRIDELESQSDELTGADD